MDSRTRKMKCFNPFRKPSTHSSSLSDLRRFPARYLWKFPNASEGSLLCTECRKEVENYQPSESEASLSHSQNSTSGDGDCVIEDRVDKILGISPVKRKHSWKRSYMADKLEQMHDAVRKKFKEDFDNVPFTKLDLITQEHSEMIQNIKEAFSSEKDRSKQIQLLSILPQKWTYNKINREISNSTRSLIDKAKELRNKRYNQENIVVKKKPGQKCLDASTAKKVVEFYENEENSKQLPGKKDVKSVIQENGQRKLVQKKLVLMNLSELYANFQEKYPSDRISFSKFASLRPQHCVLAGSSGTHTVCVCTTHENVRLMLEGFGFKALFKNSTWIDSMKPSYKDLLEKLVCSNPTESCYSQNCISCPKTDDVYDKLQSAFEEQNIEEIHYKKWTTTDRCTILDVYSEAEEFLDTLMADLKKLLFHDIVASKQSRHLTEVKENLKPGEFVVIQDFAENFTFVVQDAAQAFHWNNDQATLFSTVTYYRENDEIKHFCLVGISDCLKHDSVAVYMFQENIIKQLKLRFKEIKKIFYFSDGAPQQFKNKKAFANLCHHYNDFGIEAEWHFFATAHGKGPCDGVAGTVKRLATKASLQRGSQNAILTDLYRWAEANIDNIDFFFLKSDVYELKTKFLEERFSAAKPIKGTQRFHTFIPVTDQYKFLEVKIVSDSENVERMRVLK